MELEVSIIFFLHALRSIAENSETIQYSSIQESVTLICNQLKGAKDLRWRKDNFILTNGQKINKGIAWHRKLMLENKPDGSQYNLQISNVSSDDFGVYLCEMQIRKEILRQRVSLRYKEFQKSSTAFLVSTEFYNRNTESTLSAFETNTRAIQTTFVDKEHSVTLNDTKYTSYGLIGAGFVVVLLLSIGCNICINNYRNRAMRAQLSQHVLGTEMQSLKNGDENIQELGSVDEISNVSSKYETINEHDIAVLNTTIHECKIEAQSCSRSLSPAFDQSYLEVIGDDVVSIEGSMIKIKTEKSEEPFNYYIDAELNSYRAMNSNHSEESNKSSTSNSPIHVDMECVNKLIERKIISTKKKEFINPYLTLNSSEMNNCQSCYTTVKTDTKSRITTEKQSSKAIKRHSCP